MDPANVAREVQKIVDTLEIVHEMMAHEAKMNAAKHLSLESVRPTPLAVRVDAALKAGVQLIEDLHR